MSNYIKNQKYALVSEDEFTLKMTPISLDDIGSYLPLAGGTMNPNSSIKWMNGDVISELTQSSLKLSFEDVDVFSVSSGSFDGGGVFHNTSSLKAYCGTIELKSYAGNTISIGGGKVTIEGHFEVNSSLTSTIRPLVVFNDVSVDDVSYLKYRKLVTSYNVNASNTVVLDPNKYGVVVLTGDAISSISINNGEFLGQLFTVIMRGGFNSVAAPEIIESLVVSGINAPNVFISNIRSYRLRDDGSMYGYYLVGSSRTLVWDGSKWY